MSFSVKVQVGEPLFSLVNKSNSGDSDSEKYKSANVSLENADEKVRHEVS